MGRSTFVDLHTCRVFLQGIQQKRPLRKGFPQRLRRPRFFNTILSSKLRFLASRATRTEDNATGTVLRSLKGQCYVNGGVALSPLELSVVRFHKIRMVVSTYLDLCLRLYLHLHPHVYLCTDLHVCLYLCLYLYLYLYVYVYIYIHIYRCVVFIRRRSKPAAVGRKATATAPKPMLRSGAPCRVASLKPLDNLDRKEPQQLLWRILWHKQEGRQRLI